MVKSTAIAVPHTRIGSAPPKGEPTLAGSLVWWRFHHSAGEFSDLARAAKSAKLSPLFLPLPHPVSQEVAFNRMVRAGQRVIGSERWRTERVDPRVATRAAVRLWIRRQRSQPSHIASAQRWEPEGSARRPYRVRLALRLRDHPTAAYLPTEDVVEILMMVSLPKLAPKAVDITDSAVKVARDATGLGAETKALGARISGSWPSVSKKALAGIAGCLEMAAHLFRVLDRERTLATSSEIGEGVMDALEIVGGVKIRPGLYAVPGMNGVQQAERVHDYLVKVPGCRAGMFDLYKRGGAGKLAALIGPVLELDVIELREKIERLEVDGVGVGALRNVRRLLDAESERLKLNGPFLLRADLRKLEGSLSELRAGLRRKTRLKEELDGRKIDLEPPPRPVSVRHLLAGMTQLLAIGKSASADDVHDAADELRLGGGAVPALGCVLLLRRLLKLAEAVEHAVHSRVHPHPTKRLKILFDALAKGTRDFEASCTLGAD